MHAIRQTQKVVTPPPSCGVITEHHFTLYGRAITPVRVMSPTAPYTRVMARYVEEELGRMPEGGLMEVLESANLMGVVDRWMLRKTIAFLAEQQCGWDDPRNTARCSVPVSVSSLYDDAFATSVIKECRNRRLAPCSLRLELPENAARAHAVALERLGSALRPIGCGFTLTSYTGDLIRPVRLPTLGVDSVAICDKLVSSMHRNLHALVSVRAINVLCKSHGVHTIAETEKGPDALPTIREMEFDYMTSGGLRQLLPPSVQWMPFEPPGVQETRFLERTGFIAQQTGVSRKGANGRAASSLSATPNATNKGGRSSRSRRK